MGPLTCLFQDTVVALHALSRYGAATFTSARKAAQVTIQSSGTFSTKFQVENSNRLLLQQVSLPEVPGEYSTLVYWSLCLGPSSPLLPDSEPYSPLMSLHQCHCLTVTLVILWIVPTATALTATVTGCPIGDNEG